MKAGPIPHLPSVVAIFSKRCLIIPVPGLQKLEVLFWMAALRRYMVVAVTYMTVYAAIRKGEA